MQPKFTRKKFPSFFRRFLFPVLLLCIYTGSAKAQIITLTTEGGTDYLGTNTFGAVPSAVTFVIQNTNGFPVTLTGVDSYFNPASIGAVSGTVPTLWFSSTSLSGAPNIATPTWTSIVTGPPVTIGAAGYYNVLNGMTFVIPAGTTYRFALQSTQGLSYSGFDTPPFPTPNQFSANGVNLQLGNFQIAGQNVGWAGGFPAPARNPRSFTGRVTINVSSSPCSGTPNPGNTVASANPVCPTIPFTLSLQNTTPGSGVTYQWQSSPTGAAGSFVNVPTGGTGSTYTTSLSATTWYRALVTCAGNTTPSNPVQVNMTPPSGCYCIPPATDCTDDDEILRVQFGTIDNSSTCGTGPPPGYTNYPITPTTTTDVVKGASMPMTVTMKTVWPEVVSVWIDYNQNGAFEPTEYSLIGNKPAGTAVITGNVNAPAGALTGQTRMRVRGRFATAWGPGDACLGGGFAETEDYTVNVVPCIPLAITQQPANATIQCSGNATFSVTLTGHFPTYVWEYKPVGSPVWLIVPNAPPYSGVNTSTLTITNAPSTLNGTQYRVVYSGACTGFEFSNAATLTVNPLVATVSPASATICTGSIQQLTLTNAASPATATFNSTVNNQAIPDNNPTGITNTIAVSGIPAGAIVTNVSVTFNLTHTWVGDLDINLIAPNNANMNLVGGLDGGTGSNSTDNFTNTVISSTSTNPISGAPAPRTGTFAAERRVGYGPTGNTQTVTNIPWSALTGTLNGNWRLAIADFFAFDVGVLQNWSISITYGAAAQGVWTANPATPNTMFTDPAATVPYVAGSQAGTIYVNPTVNTVYTVVYSTATPCTSGPTNVPVNVTNPISNLAVAPATRTACVGGSTTFTATANGGPITWQWEVSTNGGTTWTPISGATAATLTVSNIQQTMQNYRYRVVATAAPCGSSTSTTFGTLNVNALPQVTVSSPQLVITPGQTTTITVTSTPAGATFKWFRNGVEIAGATTNSITVGIDDLGAYSAEVTDGTGCTAKSANEVVIGADASERLWIYPNPATDGKFQVRLFNSGTPAERRILKVFNTAGVLVFEKVFILTNTSHPYERMDVDLSKYAAGTYLVQVFDRFGGKVAGGFVVTSW